MFNNQIKYRRKIESNNINNNQPYTRNSDDPYGERPPNPSPAVTNLRKCQSIEWSVEESEDSYCSNMMTLDRRISSSSEHLDRGDRFMPDRQEYSRDRYGGCEMKYGIENQRSVPECSSGREFIKILKLMNPINYQGEHFLKCFRK